MARILKTISLIRYINPGVKFSQKNHFFIVTFSSARTSAAASNVENDNQSSFLASSSQSASVKLVTFKHLCALRNNAVLAAKDRLSPMTNRYLLTASLANKRRLERCQMWRLDLGWIFSESSSYSHPPMTSLAIFFGEDPPTLLSLLECVSVGFGS